MKKSHSEPFSRKWYWWALGSILLLVLLALVAIHLYLNPWAEKKLKAQIYQKTHGVYTLYTKSVRVSLLSGSVTIDSLHLKPNLAVWRTLDKQNPAQAAASLADLHAAKLHISGLQFIQLFQEKPQTLTLVELETPVLRLTQMKQDTSPPKPLHEKWGPPFQGLKIGRIRVQNGAVSFKEKPTQKRALYSVAGLSVQGWGVEMDSAAFQDTARAFYMREFTANARETSYYLGNGNYVVKSGAIQADSKTREATLAKLQLVPLRSAAAMSKVIGEAATRLRVQIPAVRMRQVDFHTLSRSSNVHIGAVLVQEPNVSAYKNDNYLPTKKEGKLPHDFIRQLPTGVNIRKVQVKDLYVRYDEIAANAFKPGYVTGSHINFTLTNLTNDRRLMSRKTPAILKVSGLLMGKAFLQATVRLPLLDPSGYHTMQGTIGRGNPAILNPIIEPSMFVSVKSGFLQKGSFAMELTRVSASGSLQLQYDEFQISLLNEEKEKKQSLGKKLKSLVTNKIVLKSESEKDGKAPRHGEIKFQRRRERSFLTYWKDCLANGVLSVIGAPK
ncbi:hypothetical protein [Rufibacter quisquiliarum]|uniref:DUF748 domain-containing protein n=1 Tax=Rufibacter quisquiliarum TaxID=1549639 RepID=A0A839GJT3_9BACT|nr:hypothetical protein [Rufibacter quisquiliarum]MBA9079854.1 hypothetical protein [Rufibacter quisquiliarum]